MTSTMYLHMPLSVQASASHEHGSVRRTFSDEMRFLWEFFGVDQRYVVFMLKVGM